MTRWRRTTACERAAQWISLDLDGELSRLEQAALARHLGRCDRCRSSRAEIGGFTLLLREAPPVEPARAIVVPTPAWARRRARATLRGGALALAVIAALTVGVTSLTEPVSPPSSSLGFSGLAQQKRFALEHVRHEPASIVVVPAEPVQPPAHSFGSRVVL